MSTEKNRDLKALLAVSLEEKMIGRYGPMLGGRNLCQALGYPSLPAMRQAVARGKVTVPIFTLEDRRGKFALCEDVARWIAEQRMNLNTETIVETKEEE